MMLRDIIIKEHKRILEQFNMEQLVQKGHYVIQITESTFRKPYTCRKSLEELKPISISMLKIDCAHIGKYLKGKIILPPAKIKAIHLIIEDDNQDIVRVSLYNYDDLLLDSNNPSTLFPLGRILYILEPYYKYAGDGIPVIRIESPNDLLFADTLNQKREKSSFELKNEANICFQDCRYHEAFDLYTLALQKKDLDKDFKLKCILWSNQAAALIALESYEMALDSVKKALEIDPSYHKACYRMAQALIELGRYDEVKSILTSLKAAVVEEGLVEPLIARLNKYIANSKGSFDWKSIIMGYFEGERGSSLASSSLSGSSASARIAVGNYTNPKIKIEKLSSLSSTHASGLGVIAMESITKGELLVVEKAFAYVRYDELRSKGIVTGFKIDFFNSQRILSSDEDHERLLKQKILRICRRDPYRRKDLYSMYNGILNEGLDLNERRKYGYMGGDIENLESIERIRELNVLSNMGLDMIFKEIRVGNELDKTNGLWVYSSFFNHSCQPNADYFTINNLMIIRALQDIPKGKEIYLAYLDVNQSFTERQEKLQTTWGFKCKCLRCIEEARQSADKDLKELKRFIKMMIRDYTQVESRLPKLFVKLAKCDNPLKIGLYSRVLKLCFDCRLFLSYFHLLKSLDEDLKKHGKFGAYWLMTFIRGFLDLSLCLDSSSGANNADKALEIKEIASRHYGFVFENKPEGFDVLIERTFKKALEIVADVVRMSAK